jgi:hypothetical protein
MGLDNIAMIKVSENDYRQAPDVIFGDVELCQGMLTSGSSFRGKVYNTAVEAITGQSLYENIGPDRLREMAESLGNWMASHPGQGYVPLSGYGETTREELAMLANFFRVCASNDLYLYAWY